DRVGRRPMSQEKHLEFVQAVITRMATNSFLLKGWNVSIATGLLALGARDLGASVAILTLLPGVTFWCLDAYYLRQERLFRCLYEDLCSPDFKPGEKFSLSTRRYSDSVPGWPRTLWTPTIAMLHGSVVATALIAAAALCRH